MYTVTFFSFKGGVGRTMAMVNVGMQLATTGRRVLLVDFDLSAPGLDTFNLPTTRKPSLGLVDFVTDYLETNHSPDASEYIYEATSAASKDGGLWIMTAGRQDASYASRLSAIDWRDLYQNRDGYLLFEDLKNQWKQHISPDYVLIDALTGFTDITGICTRQLPDAVVVLFSPNTQNLRGLKKVVEDIRQEGTGPTAKHINLHFVMSNVPDLDDEDRILAGIMRSFEEELGYDAPDQIIHRYDSLALLNQTIFTVDRSQSRLAREYVRLTDKIVDRNLGDRQAALRLLNPRNRRSARYWRWEDSSGDLGTRLEEIKKLHPKDPEVLAYVASHRQREGRTEDALALLDESLAMGFDRPWVRLEHAQCSHLLGSNEVAKRDLLAVLNSTEPSSSETLRAVGLLRRVDPEELAKVGEAKAVQALDFDSLLSLVNQLQWHASALPTAITLLRSLVAKDELNDQQHAQLLNSLSLCLIGSGNFKEARDLLAQKAASEPGSIDVLFNFAVAEWGNGGEPDEAVFRRVIALDAQKPKKHPGANYLQCLSLAHIAIGDPGTATRLAKMSRQEMIESSTPEFSCWRYLNVSPQDFVEDLDAQLRMIGGERTLPRFMSRPDDEIDGSADARSK